MRLIDLRGESFGRLTVVSRTANRAGGKHVAWHCRCDCGREIVATSVHLRAGHTRSCGCLLSDVSRSRLTTHGHSRGGRPSREWASWSSAKNRCFNPRDAAYADYGGRGITMCDRWRRSFAAFIDNMGVRPDGMSLDRIDVDGDYEPGNCRWATDVEQANNRRRSLIVTYDGKRMPLKQLCRGFGQPYLRVYRLFVQKRMAIEAAIVRAFEIEQGKTKYRRPRSHAAPTARHTAKAPPLA
jgi:hypothetical protein